MQPIIWALTDGKTGNDNQTLAVAQKLGNYQVRPIQYSFLAKLHNCLLGSTSIGIKTRFEPPWPNIVISAGRRPSRVARLIKKRSPETMIIQLQWSGCGYNDFDLSFTPIHDNIKPRPNLITTLTPPNRITPELLATNAEKWRQRIPVDAKPAIAVLVGNLSESEAKRLISVLNRTTGYLMITTSRRTKSKISAILKTGITRERYFFKWGENGENPYLGFISLADVIITTNDSVSMIGESVSTGKPVYIYHNKVAHKHRQFSNTLIKEGYARLLENENLEAYNYEPLNTLNFITIKIREKIEN